MDAAYAVDGILDFDLPPAETTHGAGERQGRDGESRESDLGLGQGDATVLAWARAM